MKNKFFVFFRKLATLRGTAISTRQLKVKVSLLCSHVSWVSYAHYDSLMIFKHCVKGSRSKSTPHVFANKGCDKEGDEAVGSNDKPVDARGCAFFLCKSRKEWRKKAYSKGGPTSSNKNDNKNLPLSRRKLFLAWSVVVIVVLIGKRRVEVGGGWSRFWGRYFCGNAIADTSLSL